MKTWSRFGRPVNNNDDEKISKGYLVGVIYENLQQQICIFCVKTIRSPLNPPLIRPIFRDLIKRRAITLFLFRSHGSFGLLKFVIFTPSSCSHFYPLFLSFFLSRVETSLVEISRVEQPYLNMFTDPRLN